MAGTSPITVSRTLRYPDKVAPQTRSRVLAAIEALSYVPNLAASSLASHRSGIVAVLVPTIGNSIFTETIQGISDAVAGAGLQILLGDYSYSPEREHNLVRALIGRQPEAIVMVGAVRSASLRTLLKSLSVPVIETWDLTRNPVDTVVGFSNREVGAAVARYLLVRGRSRLGFVGGLDPRSKARGAGFTQALVKAGAPPPALEIVDGTSITTGRQAGARILDRAPETDAVFFASDVLAVGGLLLCQKQGIAVPREVALVGLGDLEIARELRPALTTVKVPAYEIGKRAGNVILARQAGDTDSGKVIDLGFSIIERESSY